MTTVNELFETRYGHSLELNRLKQSDPDSGIAFVSRQMGNNGISAFVERIRDVIPAHPGEMSVALGGNGVLTTFLQDRPFYTGRDVAILKPRTPLAKSVLLYYCMCIKANRYRHSYGRQANRSLRSLVVPALESLPDWVSKTDVDLFSEANRPKHNKIVNLNDRPHWNMMCLGDLFIIRKGKRLVKAKMVAGPTPFIGALKVSNGLVGRILGGALHPGNTLTVNYNGIGGVAESFYQPEPYMCSDDVNVLYPKFPMTPSIGLFIATIIRREKYRFSFGRKWHLGRMLKSEIRLPVDTKGVIALDFMEQFIGSLPYSSQL